MRIPAFFIKSWKENLRDWKILCITLIFAPFFVYLMYLYFNGSGTAGYVVALLNLDTSGSYARDLVHEWEQIKDANQKPLLTLQTVTDAETGKKLIKNKNADLLVTLPADFSATCARFLATREGAISALTSYGDQTNIRYTLAAAFCDYVSYTYIGTLTGVTVPFDVRFETAQAGKNLREFDLYVPALLVLALIMVLFTAAASVVREFEKGTIIRLKVSKLTSFEFLMAVTGNQLFIGLASLALTLLASLSIGYRTDGSWGLFLLVGTVTCLAVIAISLITACFVKNMFGLLTIGCFPLFILMFFSDCFFPLPRLTLFVLGGNAVYLNDLLPTATATRAFNKLLNFNAHFGEIAFELGLIFIVTSAYFVAGVLLFRNRLKSAER